MNFLRRDGIGDVLFMQPALKRLMARGDAMLWTTKALLPVAELMGVNVGDADGGAMPGNVRDHCHALEGHSWRYVLDRVTLWELILGAEVTETPVAVTLPGGGRERIEAHPAYRTGLLNLYFSPIVTHGRQREWRDGLVRSVIPGLVARFNVVVASAGAMPGGLAHDGALQFPDLPLPEWFALVGGCDAALTHDTGGAWIASAGGIPTVATFNTVPPWLRARRFPNVRSVFMRLPKCNCDHHDGCPFGDYACCEGITAAELIGHVEAAMRGERGVWEARTGKAVQPPTIEVPEEFAELLLPSCVGVDVRVVAEPTTTQVLKVNRSIQTGEPIAPSREAVWNMLTEALRRGGRRRGRPQENVWVLRPLSLARASSGVS
ncbi:MAG: hypothetical protein PHZ19_01745, partial [Candidatus Thermoplasmatota archaeon]|nr:hypothetical protein [Candidatus Thermoplasmatota archaeon]